MASDDVPKPPEPPSIGRTFSPARSQLLGVSALALFVVLGLFGLFGETKASVAAEGGGVRLEVTHPQRFRFKTIDTVDVEVTNTGNEDLASVTVRVDRPFVEAHSNARFAPSITRLTGEAYEVELQDVRAGQTRPVSVEVQAERYWRHTGFVEAVTPEGSVRVDVYSFVFP